MKFINVAYIENGTFSENHLRFFRKHTLDKAKILTVQWQKIYQRFMRNKYKINLSLICSSTSPN